MKAVSRLTLASLALMISGTALARDASDLRWLIHLGPSRLSFADKAVVEAGGSPVAGAGIRSEAHYTASIDIARFVAPTVALSFAVGIPPKVGIDGAGTLAPSGRLTKLTYVAPAITARWHPFAARAVSPYVGAGITYMHVLKASDRTLRQTRVDDDLGAVLQSGVTVAVTRRWGFFADVKKGFVRTEARGTVGAAPIDARIKMDPLVVQAGLSLRL